MSEPVLAIQRGHRALRQGRVSLEGHYYHITTTTHARQPLFAEFWAARVVVRSLNAPALLGTTELFAWVLMPDHLHALVRLGEDDTLARFVDRLKGLPAGPARIRVSTLGRRVGLIAPKRRGRA